MAGTGGEKIFPCFFSFEYNRTNRQNTLDLLALNVF